MLTHWSSFLTLKYKSIFKGWISSIIYMVTIREAREGDVDALVDLVIRLKRLNSEFDPLFSARNDCAERAREYLLNALRNSKNYLVLVAEDMEDSWCVEGGH